MEPAVAPFRRALGGIDLREPRVTVYSGVTARPFEDFARQLVEALTKPVRWRETLLALRDAGAERFVEVGPGKVLRNLAKRTVPDQESASLAQLEVASA
jgi:malonyl CoA-acyl carrier protein transacylase